MSLNKYMGIGNIANDLNLEYTPTGTAVLKFSVACNSVEKKAGENVKSVYYANVVAWGKRAENINEFCQKGSKVYIEGKMKRDSWNDRETRKKMYRDILKLDVIDFLDKKGFVGSTPVEENYSTAEENFNNSNELNNVSEMF